jgi:MFS family permease
VAGSLALQSAMTIVVLFLPARWFQILGFALIGMLNGVLNVNFMTLLQTATPPALLGRVQSLATTGSTAVMPLGMALAGIFFDLVGKNVSLMYVLGAGSALLCSLVGLLSPAYREFLRFIPPKTESSTAAGPSAP